MDIVFRYTIFRYIIRYFRAKWLINWEKDDVIYAINTNFLLGFIDPRQDKVVHFYKCRAIKWDVSECEVIIDDNDGDANINKGDQIYLPMRKVVSNTSCKERMRQSKMDKFMITHSSKAEERDKKLEDILKK